MLSALPLISLCRDPNARQATHYPTPTSSLLSAGYVCMARKVLFFNGF